MNRSITIIENFEIAQNGRFRAIGYTVNPDGSFTDIQVDTWEGLDIVLFNRFKGLLCSNLDDGISFVKSGLISSCEKLVSDLIELYNLDPIKL